MGERTIKLLFQVPYVPELDPAQSITCIASLISAKVPLTNFKCKSMMIPGENHIAPADGLRFG